MWKLVSACIGIGRYWQGLNRILNQGLGCELWRDLLTLTPIARDPKSSEDQTPQQIAFQLDSHVYAMGQAATQVKT